MKKKYFANMSVNNGTSYIQSLEFTNKKEAIKYIIDSVKCELFCGNRGRWRVGDEEGIFVAAGEIEKSAVGKFHFTRFI